MIEMPLADVVFPTFLLISPLLVVAFIPVFLLESWVMARRLRVQFRKVVGSVVVSNLVTTLLGVPLLGILLTLLPISCKNANLFGFNCAYPNDGLSVQAVVTTVTYILLCFGLSCLVEGLLNAIWIGRKNHTASSETSGSGKLESQVPTRKAVWKSTIWANFASYAFLCALFIVCSMLM